MVEDFTFPSIPPEQCGSKKLPFPHFASTPPWFVVPIAGDAAAAHDHHRRCFSAVEHAGKASNGEYLGARSERFTVVEEHKMDMLWEDFNEELSRAAPPCPLSKEWASEAWLAGDGTLSRHVVAASGCSVVRRRRLSLLMMLKLLKKLFLGRRKSSATTSRTTPPI
ncbi:uncharacterized protein LOC124690201 [Lolium rigidum]|uniref:uncharacterized protein LOC124690201 n=1 Tax=Lolium rigidum TaxID=89674 RepID=UPI001F5E24D1|nr:uncharacterized protein LOC124690201 [Lolium rigidum]